MEDIRFDDVQALGAQVNEEFGEWGPEIEIGQGMVNNFADVTGDHQWIHVEVERAKKSPLGGTIVHGFFLMGLLIELMPKQKFNVVGSNMVVNYGGDRYRFISMVPVGSRVHMRVRLAGVKPKGNGVLLTQAYEVAVVGAEKPALAGELMFMHM